MCGGVGATIGAGTVDAGVGVAFFVEDAEVAFFVDVSGQVKPGMRNRGAAFLSYH